MIEAVIPCSHGWQDAHFTEYQPDLEYDCPGGRRVRLVEVQPDYEAAAKELREWFLNGDSLVGPEARRIVDAAVPGPTYRLEEVE